MGKLPAFGHYILAHHFRPWHSLYSSW